MQPVSVEDVATICADAGATDEDVVLDAAGPEMLSYDTFVRLVAAAVGRKVRVVHLSPRTTSALAPCSRSRASWARSGGTSS